MPKPERTKTIAARAPMDLARWVEKEASDNSRDVSHQLLYWLREIREGRLVSKNEVEIQ